MLAPFPASELANDCRAHPVPRHVRRQQTRISPIPSLFVFPLATVCTAKLDGDVIPPVNNCLCCGSVACQAWSGSAVLHLSHVDRHACRSVWMQYAYSHVICMTISRWLVFSNELDLEAALLGWEQARPWPLLPEVDHKGSAKHSSKRIRMFHCSQGLRARRGLCHECMFVHAHGLLAVARGCKLGIKKI